MGTSTSEKVFRDLVQTAGITVNGNASYDIQVRNSHFYQRVLAQGSLELGESYMDGWWDCEQLDEFINRVLRADLPSHIKSNLSLLWHVLHARLFNLQSKKRAFQVGERHYDIGNDLYEAMLDSRMNYTCAYWRGAKNLDQAQENKLELVCKKIGLQSGMTVLELGCGFGAFAGYAAQKYGAHVTGVTVSKKQVEWATAKYKNLPVDIRLQDYRSVRGQYDRVISIGIMEHVGYKNYRTYMQVVDRTLKPDGLAFIHTIGGTFSGAIADPWTVKYIFPNGSLPSMAQLTRAMEGLFDMEDWHNFGPDYDQTLLAWYANFAKAWPELKSHYDERFYRMWRYYLLSAAGGFRARHNQLWQMVLNRPRKDQPTCRYS
ncbi:cyclopropane fatty acyl phospholipid synthase [candidate division KSB1 bacterium]|nr:MAG: cyclopropane fatty acyl phospholipid synthase [candidate division KSB1 bacterium]